MGLIAKELWVIGNRGRRKVRALFDTGFPHSVMSERVARQIGEPHELPEPKRYEAAVGAFIAREGVFADIVVHGKRLLTGLTVVHGLTEEVILGADFLQRWHIRLDPRRRRVVLDPAALRLKAVGTRHHPRRMSQ